MRHVSRGLRRSPAFVATVVVTLGVGIGISAAVFNIAEAALFEGYPLVERNDRLVYVTTTKDAVYYPDYVEWRASSKELGDVALVRNIFVTLRSGDGDVESYFTTAVTPNTFSLLHVKPMLGRDFRDEDGLPGSEPVALLRYDLWQSRFGADPSIVGRSVQLNGVSTTVIGVMPQGFSFPTDQYLWTPLIPTTAALRRETPYARYAVARLAAGATIQSARLEMAVIGERLSSAYSSTNRGVSPVLQTFAEWSAGPKGSRLYEVALGAVALVLLIVCANTAILLLERTLARSRHVAIRSAIGATWTRIARELFLESFALSVLSGAVGWWIAVIGIRAYMLMLPSGEYTRILGYAMDYRTLGFVVAVSAGAGLIVSAIAATGLANVDLGHALRSGTATVSRNGARLAGLLVAFQIGLAVVLLAGSGLLVRTYVKIASADVGVRGDDILSMSMYVPPERYADAISRTTFYSRLRERLAALPGVESVGFGTAAPSEYVPTDPYELDGIESAEDSPRPTVARFVASADYFETLGIRVLAGRAFADTDGVSSAPVVIVNSLFARAHWPSKNPIGRRVRLFVGGQFTPWLTVVGVVANVMQNDQTRQRFDPLVYVPYEQSAQPNMFTFARTGIAPASLVAAFRREVYELDPALPVPALWPLRERFDRIYAFERLSVKAFLVFAMTAVLLASVGLYAVLSRTINKRTHEVGVRAALGATARDIRNLVIKAASAPVGLGLLVGSAASLVANRVLEPELVGVSASDPMTLSLVVLVLLIAAVGGCLVPLRRALRVNPVVALRHD